MRSLLRSVKKRKKRRVLGEVEVMSREEYSGLELDSKVEMIRALIPLGLMHVEELLDEEVKALAGERYARKEATLRGRRHGSNPGTVGLGGQRVPVRVPRVRSVAGGEIPLRSYEELSPDGAVNELLLRRVLYGISCRNYESAAEAIPGAIGLSSSTVSRGFVQASAAKLRQMQERDLSAEDVVAIFLDGKMFADATMVVALGITITGDKRFLGFVETSTENEQVLTPFLRSLMERGLDISEGVLVIVDGGKGLRAAVKRAFGNRALVQRCQWHKRENVVSYLSKTEQAAWRKRLQRAYQRTTKPGRPSNSSMESSRSETNRPLRALRKAWRRPSRCIDSACTGSWAVRSRRRIAWNRSMPSSTRRSIIGRTRASGSADGAHRHRTTLESPLATSLLLRFHIRNGNQQDTGNVGQQHNRDFGRTSLREMAVWGKHEDGG